ncbi:hypothetical protein Bca4012_048579 [Brassica carinata]
MKRKREHSCDDKENERPSNYPEMDIRYQKKCIESQSISRIQSLAREDVQSSVEISSVFKRLFGVFEKRPINTNNASVKGHITSTPKTLRNIFRNKIGNSSSRHEITLPLSFPTRFKLNRDKSRIVLGVSLDSDQATKTPDQRSCLTSLKSQVSNNTVLGSTQRPIQGNLKNYKRMALDDITNTASKEGVNTSTPKTPSNKRRRRNGVCLDSDQANNTPDQSSCLTSLNSQVLKATDIKTRLKTVSNKQQKNRRALLHDIASISNSIAFDFEDTPSKTVNDRDEDNVPDDDEAIDDCDDDFGGIIEELDGDLEFDCSSQESSESELDEDIVDHSIGEKTCSNKHQRKRKAMFSKETVSKMTGRSISIAYIDEGDPTYSCCHCGAIMWYGERINKRRNARTPTFTLCCMQGQVKLPLLQDPPDVLKRLLEGDDKLSKHFQRNLRPYNMVFSFTSLGGKVERSVMKGIGPDMFQLQGENYHLAGSLFPKDGTNAKFGQLYIADTDNELENRAKCLR